MCLLLLLPLRPAGLSGPLSDLLAACRAQFAGGGFSAFPTFLNEEFASFLRERHLTAL